MYVHSGIIFILNNSVHTCICASKLHWCITLVHGRHLSQEVSIISVTSTGQYEEMKKIKEDLEEELQRERSAHRHYKRECSALKEEYNNLRLKVSPTGTVS